MDVSAIVKVCAPPVINSIITLLKGHMENERFSNEIEIKIENHLLEVLGWSDKIQLFGMYKPNYTDDSTVDLSFGIPRKFRSSKNNVIEEEAALLTTPEHLLILGDPGAGKTTTLKKIARRILLSAPDCDADIFQFPVVIKLREATLPLYHQIATVVGIDIREKKVTQFVYVKKNGISEKKEKTVTRLYVGNDHITVALPKILNESRALLMLDGLDEMPFSQRKDYENDIKQLSHSLVTSRIIVTCRSGGYVDHLSGFYVLEICPLDDNQIASIINKCANCPDKFNEALSKYPYADTANRPLFLNQLITTYNYYGDFPNQPVEIYERLINLLLTQWDLHRKVKRQSKYSTFYPEKKMRFLAAIAYELTYRIKSKLFSEKDLIVAYNRIYKRFGLPKKEAELVAQEIESHTGIITQSTDRRYEFSHLSLQEFLCAFFIVREPTVDMISMYLQEYSPPVAVSIALSSSPENFFSSCFLRGRNYYSLSNESIKELLSRLLIEDPMFSESPELGMSFMKLLFEKGIDEGLLQTIQNYFKYEAVVLSIGSVLSCFGVLKGEPTDELYYLSKLSNLNIPGRLREVTPEGGAIPKTIINFVMDKCLLKLHEFEAFYAFVSR